jgi:hypothetical protein
VKYNAFYLQQFNVIDSIVFWNLYEITTIHILDIVNKVITCLLKFGRIDTVVLWNDLRFNVSMLCVLLTFGAYCPVTKILNYSCVLPRLGRLLSSVSGHFCFYSAFLNCLFFLYNLWFQIWTLSSTIFIRFICVSMLPFRRNKLLEHHNYFLYLEVDLYHCKRENV